eukprot:CAMPEP_0184362142 /NCGR_PEP_ID=MMETSP1089-20130417/133552_1 /TAXON_ID=38269 ORGANISM="Gloeochaete wittrockiana, Strain SAG46.84" /NCGR_SAMPLE_ID=MMETSP1089 /ASSEMBLY_ACC=CAM_ASM_000445 /LENGTH=45 /DNA_ID= /DNA_START= /DNA_END= /DNA_ORIENTATION=
MAPPAQASGMNGHAQDGQASEPGQTNGQAPTATTRKFVPMDGNEA